MRLSAMYPSEPSDEPSRQDFPDHDTYLLAWHTWRALRRDERLTDEERAARFEVQEAHVRRLFERPTA